MRKTILFTAAAIAACLAVLPADANGGKKSMAAPMHPAATAPTTCAGGFSNGASIDIAAPVDEIEVGWVPASGYGKKPPFPAINGTQVTSCDVHTFAWNQFLYLTAGATGTTGPRFMNMAPWYNVLLPNGSKPPGAYPGGSTALEAGRLDQGQAGNDNHLLDTAGNTVLYDIRFDPVMYSGIVGGNVYTADLYTTACAPDAKTGVCANENSNLHGTKVWLPPQFSNEGPEAGSIEVKTSWRDFGAPGKCPSDFYCNGRFGLVGLHYVNKTFYHGEWIWATFEHVANDPDCAPTGDAPISPLSPLKTPWSFFSDKTIPPSVLKSKMCNVASSPPQCNGNPNPSGDKKTWIPINVCRTIPAGNAGGASAANCAIAAGTSNVAGNIACLNATIAPQLSGPWKNYKLVGALWVVGGAQFMEDFRIAGFQSPLPGYDTKVPTGIPYLANTTMETWFQHNSNGYRQTGAITGNGGADAGCFLCHNLPSSFKANGNKEMDLSHFPGKLPASALTAMKSSLVPANSSMPVPK